MPDRDPRTVFVADNPRLAEAVIQLLAANGIPAEIEQVPPAPVSALTGMSEERADEFPILVTEPKKVDEARDLLTLAENKTAVYVMAEKRAARTGDVTATCEECGKESTWPAKAMGTTEICPHCSGYMDVPDPDDDWSDVDFGAEDGDNDADST